VRDGGVPVAWRSSVRSWSVAVAAGIAHQALYQLYTLPLLGSLRRYHSKAETHCKQTATGTTAYFE